jgi:hypothetical protein
MTTLMPHRQRGATLAIALIMLVIITLMLLGALGIGTANFRTVTNMQFRDEAIAAANQAIQRVVDSPFTDDPTAEMIEVDIDQDGTNDYQVEIAQPQCISASVADEPEPSSVGLGPIMTLGSTWNTVWDIDANVTGVGNIGGASVRVRTGVRVLLSETEVGLVCS